VSVRLRRRALCSTESVRFKEGRTREEETGAVAPMEEEEEEAEAEGGEKKDGRVGAAREVDTARAGAVSDAAATSKAEVSGDCTAPRPSPLPYSCSADAAAAGGPSESISAARLSEGSSMTDALGGCAVVLPPISFVASPLSVRVLSRVWRHLQLHILCRGGAAIGARAAGLPREGTAGGNRKQSPLRACADRWFVAHGWRACAEFSPALLACAGAARLG
jgi:hypothetical protein